MEFFYIIQISQISQKLTNSAHFIFSVLLPEHKTHRKTAECENMKIFSAEIIWNLWFKAHILNSVEFSCMYEYNNNIFVSSMGGLSAHSVSLRKVFECMTKSGFILF